MPREHIKPRSISRAITPRNIRAIKPKRQLAWNKQHDEVDDDLWYTTVYGDSKKQGGGSSSSSTSRPRQSYNNNIEDDDYDSEEEENDNIPRSSKICKLLSIFKAIYKCLLCICKSTKGGYDSIRKLPPTQRRNRFLLFLILICVLRIYLRSMFMNLNQYSLFKNETKSITPIVVGRSSMPLDTDDGWEESSSLFGTPKTQSKVMGAGGAASSSPLFGSSNLRGASSGLMSSGSMGSSLSSGIQQQPQTGGLNTNSLYPQQQASAGYGASGSLNTYGASGSISSSQQLQSNAIQMGMKTNLVGGSLQQQPIQQAQMPQQNQYQQQAQMPQQNQLQYNNPLQANTQTQYKQPVLGNQYSSSGSQHQSLNSGVVGNSQQSGGFGGGGGGGANMQNFSDMGLGLRRLNLLPFH